MVDTITHSITQAGQSDRTDTYRLTPLYDILSAQPSLIARQIERKQMKLAMSVGDRRHYRIDQVQGRHFVQSGMRAGLSKTRATSLIEDVAARAEDAIEAVAAALPPNFPAAIHDTVREAILARTRGLTLDNAEN